MSISVPARAPVRRVRSTGYGNRIGLAVMLAGIFVTVMDNSIVNVAIPSIRSTLGATFAEAELVVASYTFAFAVGLITGGRLGDIFGQRRMFLAGFAAFTLTSALCGFAPSPNMLIVARLLQGASASLLSPQVFSLVRTTFAEGRERTTAFAAMGVVIGVANVSGLVAGGLLQQADMLGLAWRPVFLVNVPIGVISIIVAPFVLPKAAVLSGRRLDVSGVLLSTLGLGLLMLAAFFLHQRWKTRRNLQPLLDTNLIFDRAFALGSSLIIAPRSVSLLTTSRRAGYIRVNDGAKRQTGGHARTPLSPKTLAGTMPYG